MPPHNTYFSPHALMRRAFIIKEHWLFYCFRPRRRYFISFVELYLPMALACFEPLLYFSRERKAIIFIIIFFALS